jgi:hypothetical protein
VRRVALIILEFAAMVAAGIMLAAMIGSAWLVGILAIDRLLFSS